MITVLRSDACLLASRALAANRVAKDLLTIDEEGVARVSCDAGRRAIRKLIEVDAFAEQAVGLSRLRMGAEGKRFTWLDRFFSPRSNGPATGSLENREV